MTHENVMSRNKSFRRKLRDVTVEDPEAARIEEVVKSGELKRHYSIRRKILPDITRNQTNNKGKGAITSTPEDPEKMNGLSISLGSSVTYEEENGYESIIGDDTLRKIQECFDKERFKDLFSLAGRLQDLLSSSEIEEIVNNSEIYTNILGDEIVQALSFSIHPEQEHNGTPNGNVNGSVRNQSMDSLDPDGSSEGFTFVRRNSKRLNKNECDRVVEGLFVESRGQSTNPSLKRLEVPDSLLDEEPGTAQIKSGVSNSNHVENGTGNDVSPPKLEKAPTPLTPIVSVNVTRGTPKRSTGWLAHDIILLTQVKGLFLVVVLSE